MGAIGLSLAMNQALHQHWRNRPGVCPGQVSPTCGKEGPNEPLCAQHSSCVPAAVPGRALARGQKCQLPLPPLMSTAMQFFWETLLLKEAPTPTFSYPAWIPIAHLCHPGQNLFLSGIDLLPKPKSFSGNFSFLLHCLGTTAKALKTWNTLNLKTSADGRKVSPSGSWCWRNVLGWWQSWTQVPLHSHRTQTASDICCGSPPWHSSLVPWWLGRGWKLIQTIFIGLLVATQHILPLERGTL